MSSDQRRAAIVDAAIELFAQNGFRGTTTRQLANAVGVSEPVLYMHFQTKRDLYSALIEELAQGSKCPVAAGLAGMAEVHDDEEFFRLLAAEMLAWKLDDPSRIRILLFSALEGHELSDLFYQRYVVPFHDALSAYIQKRIDEGAFRQADPLLAARAFCSMIAHYGLALTVFGNNDDAETRKATVATMVQIFLNGMKRSA